MCCSRSGATYPRYSRCWDAPAERRRIGKARNVDFPRTRKISIARLRKYRARVKMRCWGGWREYWRLGGSVLLTVTDLQREPPEHDSSRAAHSLRLNFPVAYVVERLNCSRSTSRLLSQVAYAWAQQARSLRGAPNRWLEIRRKE